MITIIKDYCDLDRLISRGSHKIVERAALNIISDLFGKIDRIENRTFYYIPNARSLYTLWLIWCGFTDVFRTLFFFLLCSTGLVATNGYLLFVYSRALRSCLFILICLSFILCSTLDFIFAPSIFDWSVRAFHFFCVAECLFVVSFIFLSCPFAIFVEWAIFSASSLYLFCSPFSSWDTFSCCTSLFTVAKIQSPF